MKGVVGDEELVAVRLSLDRGESPGNVGVDQDSHEPPMRQREIRCCSSTEVYWSRRSLAAPAQLNRGFAPVRWTLARDST